MDKKVGLFSIIETSKSDCLILKTPEYLNLLKYSLGKSEAEILRQHKELIETRRKERTQELIRERRQNQAQNSSTPAATQETTRDAAAEEETKKAEPSSLTIV